MFIVVALFFFVSLLMTYYGARLHTIVSSLYAQTSRLRGRREQRRLAKARCLARKILTFAVVTCQSFCMRMGAREGGR